MRLNFGSANDNIEGFKNVDALEWGGNTDIIWDLTKYPYPFDDEVADEIRAVELLEHISFRETINVLKEWNRILKPGGKLHIQVPAIDKMCNMFTRKQICDCVAHKPTDEFDAKGNPDCYVCKGNGQVNPVRWLMAFCGAQKHDYDTHKSIFTKKIMADHLKFAGFKNVKINYDKHNWKLKVNCNK